jgi:hypothetical protein
MENTTLTTRGVGDAYFGWAGLTPRFDNLPDALVALPQWVLWKHEGSTKVPYQPDGRRRASSTDPATWSDFSEVYAAFEEGGFDGVGFVLSDGDGFAGVDLDHCRNAETGDITPGAQEIIDRCASYTEVSPSGTGIRIICRSDYDGSAAYPEIEIYASRRFLTLTGERLNGHEGIEPVDRSILDGYAAQARSQPASDAPDRVGDHRISAIQEAGLYQRPCGGGAHEILCPWADQHSNGDTTGTRYLEPHYEGHPAPRFHCHHAHCGERTTAEFFAAIGLRPDGNRFDLDAMLQTAQPQGNTFRPLSDLFQNLGGAEYIIKPYLERETICLMYGDSDTFKSFVAADIAMCIALGRNWASGTTVEAAPVLVICGEGENAYARRLFGWVQHHGIQWNTLDIPIRVRTVPVELMEKGKSDELQKEIEAAAMAMGKPPALIIIDTLSTSFGDGDENSNTDVAKVINNVKTNLRTPFGACVLIIHHVGHGDKGRERGAYALRANSDARILVARDNDEQIHLESQKVKDGRKWAPVPLKATEVRLNGIEDNLGETETTLVLEPGDPDQIRLGGKRRRDEDAPTSLADAVMAELSERAMDQWEELESRRDEGDPAIEAVPVSIEAIRNWFFSHYEEQHPRGEMEGEGQENEPRFLGRRKKAWSTANRRLKEKFRPTPGGRDYEVNLRALESAEMDDPE